MDLVFTPIYRGSDTLSIAYKDEVFGEAGMDGRTLHVYRWFSRHPGHGWSRRALQAIKGAGFDVVVHGGGCNDLTSGVLYENYLFWIHMLESGLVKKVRFINGTTGRLKTAKIIGRR